MCALSKTILSSWSWSLNLRLDPSLSCHVVSRKILTSSAIEILHFEITVLKNGCIVLRVVATRNLLLTWLIEQSMRSSCHFRFAWVTSIIKMILIQVITFASIKLGTLSIDGTAKLVHICRMVVVRNLLFGMIKLKVIVSHKAFELGVWLSFLMIKALESCWGSSVMNCTSVSTANPDIRSKSHISINRLWLVSRRRSLVKSVVVSSKELTLVL